MNAFHELCGGKKTGCIYYGREDSFIGLNISRIVLTAGDIDPEFTGFINNDSGCLYTALFYLFGSLYNQEWRTPPGFLQRRPDSFILFRSDWLQNSPDCKPGIDQ